MSKHLIELLLSRVYTIISVYSYFIFSMSSRILHIDYSAPDSNFSLVGY